MGLGWPDVGRAHRSVSLSVTYLATLKYADEILELYVGLFKGIFAIMFLFIDDNARPHRDLDWLKNASRSKIFRGGSGQSDFPRHVSDRACLGGSFKLPRTHRLPFF
ncbi:hypothetical protein TNCV_1457231 [Trichonephila clavipes]|nr:hypothetical protein TNCV_1457231 [Trichonephila clavipes]